MRETTAADWTFETGVAETFDTYVRGQLPFYDLATAAVADLVRLHLPPGGLVVDMGASTGNIGRAIGETLTERHGRLVAVEPAEEMAAAYDAPGGIVRATAEEFEMPTPDVIVCFLTLGFISPVVRASLVDKWVASLRPGGALIAVERTSVPAVHACRYLIQSAKVRHGSTDDDVLAKDVSIAGVLRPMPADFFEPFGGSLFFAYGDFRGHIVQVPG